MNRVRIGSVAMAGVLLATSGCERPFDKTPPGYAEACYGGRSEAAKNWVCSDDRLVVSVEGRESDWPKLNRIVSDFARRRGLAVFDTSANVPGYIRTLEISVCSSDGLFLLMDKRVYSDEKANRDGNRITTHLRTYKRDFGWKPVADEFVASVQKGWGGDVQVEWPKAIAPGEKKALPDSVKGCE
jgi:hypothetical protein